MKKRAFIMINGNEDIQQEVMLTLKNKKINYQEKDGTNVLFDQSEKVLIRENKRFLMEFSFEKNIVSIYMKKEEKEVEIPIITHQLEVSKNRVRIKYKLEEQEYVYEIRMEESS